MSIRYAMILAAGRGERMRPLTDALPKPLAPVRGKPLIVYHLEKLARLGVSTVVINLAWLGPRLREALGDGSRWQLQIHYSDEGGQALETGGGIYRALPWLGTAPFLVVSGDVFTDFDFGMLTIAPEALAHLVLVPNPTHHPQGDFALLDGRVSYQGQRTLTYANIGLYRPELFEGCRPGRFPLLPVLQRAIAAGRLYGEVYTGAWANVGTPEQLSALQ
ncbi:MAG TPA: nucleotidyltransferase family protein [Steroidobacteraceae bacterium]|jgi:MurNAc alpha-1-phosphate uridylyltransferase|nr:nucleotidyltransferase family protein [Steroidobacteraceae bacterium]